MTLQERQVVQDPSATLLPAQLKNLLVVVFVMFFTLRFAQMDAQPPPGDGSTRGKHDGPAPCYTKHV